MAVPTKVLERVHRLDGLLPDDACNELARLASGAGADQAIVEIGVYKGKSLAALAAGASLSGAYVHGVDIFDSNPREKGRHAVSMRYAATTIERLGFDDMVTLHRGRSTDFAASWTGGAIGLMHIDGNHRYKAVLADIDAWTPHLAPGAVLVFDDYHREVTGVADAVHERFGVPDDILAGRLAMIQT